MNADYASAPWHAASVDRFLLDRLPELLGRRLPLSAYRVEPDGDHACTVTVAVRSEDGEVEAAYAGIPRPDADGIFHYRDRRMVVVPTASSDELETAEIHCAGEQIYAIVEARLGEAPKDLTWDPALLRVWLTLDAWVREFFDQTGQRLDETNWLSAKAHLRRIFLPDRPRVFMPGHYGRVCPVETPEGPNIGRVLAVSLGAGIQDGRLQILDPDAAAGFGLTAHMVPFLEHDEPARLLMGVNMLRQFLTPPDAEPALVQTGFEPDVPEFWCGRNLLTAFVSWGSDTFEDAIVISESASAKLGYPHALEPGDKFANRHGSKGVVSRILPDAEMPCLEDGTAVELVFDCMSLYSRLNVGLVREAVVGLLAHVGGAAEIVRPFHAPTERELKARLAAAELPEDGQTQLYANTPIPDTRYPIPGTLPRTPLERRATVGWVYWGKLVHIAADKMHAEVAPGRCQKQGALEFYALRECGANETIREQFNTRAAERDDASTLADRLTAGPVPQAPAPSPRAAEAARHLAAAGIATELTEGGLAFRLAPPAGPTLKLAQPIAHPWLGEQSLTEIGTCPDVPEYRAVEGANRNLERILATSPCLPSLSARARAGLEAAVRTLFDALAAPERLRFSARVLFSGRAVTAPGRGLRHDEAALPEEVAWTLFGPLLARTVAQEEIDGRTKTANEALDALMSRSWVLIHRAPVVEATGFLAFRPRRDPDRVIRIPPMTNHLLNADHDGDELAVFLPITEAGQKEAGERLTIAGHLRRDPALLGGLQPQHGARYGLALLGATPEGLAEITQLAGVEVHPFDGMVGSQSILEASRKVMEARGVEAALECLERLTARGFAVSKLSGISMSPFAEGALSTPRPPESDLPREWERYQDERLEMLLAERNSTGAVAFPFLLAALSGARGTLALIPRYFAAFGLVEDVHGRRVPVRHSLYEGVTAEELGILAVGSRRGQWQAVRQIDQVTRIMSERYRPAGMNVLDRAMRSQRPGFVFARAAANDEVDPLTSPQSRLFVGL